MDFSFAGYMGGGVPIPKLPAVQTVGPSGGDDTQAIQAALDAISDMEPKSGFRGAVLLQPGEFHCSAALTIRVSGVVLRGSGPEKSGTTLAMSGAPHVAIEILGNASWKDAGAPITITDAYVPAGTATFHVADAAGLAVGDHLRIRRPVTAEWVAFMGMDKLVRSGKDEHWISGATEMDRVIQAIKGNEITVDIALSDSLDAKYLQPTGATVSKGEWQGAVSHVGVEDLCLVAPAQAVEITAPHYSGLHLAGVNDAWVRHVDIENMVGSVGVGATARRVTVESVRLRHDVPTKGAAKPADLSVDGGQVLIDRCTGSGDNIFYFATGARVIGPNVLLHCRFMGNGHIQPHQRWATGLLVDGCEVPESGIELMNRGEMGSGHGWTMGWGVVWNCVAKSLTIQAPPGSMNWAIGCVGARETAAMPFEKSPAMPEGIYESHGHAVKPDSLYLAQLRERLGPQAVADIGY